MYIILWMFRFLLLFLFHRTFKVSHISLCISGFVHLVHISNTAEPHMDLNKNSSSVPLACNTTKTKVLCHKQGVAIRRGTRGSLSAL